MAAITHLASLAWPASVLRVRCPPWNWAGIKRPEPGLARPRPARSEARPRPRSHQDPVTGDCGGHSESRARHRTLGEWHQRWHQMTHCTPRHKEGSAEVSLPWQDLLQLIHRLLVTVTYKYLVSLSEVIHLIFSNTKFPISKFVFWQISMTSYIHLKNYHNKVTNGEHNRYPKCSLKNWCTSKLRALHLWQNNQNIDR